MEIVVAFVSMAILVIVAAYVAQPLLVKTRVKVESEDSSRDRLLAERDTIYNAIRDLDFDFQTGKLLEVDYRAMRDKYAARGVEILKELDALGDDRRLQTADRRQSVAAVDEIEAAVQARRKAKSVPMEDDIEAAVRARRQAADRNPKSESLPPAVRSGPYGSAGVESPKCPNCGRPIDPNDRFCARCGASLTVEATL